MKSVKYLFIVLLVSLGCEEIPPIITPAGEEQPNVNTPVEDQSRQVLMEEFSGVRCVNCPAGSEAIEVLISIYGERLVPVSIHSGFFAAPYPESRYDFQTQAGNSLLDYLSQPLGYPTASVNRKTFAGEESLQLNQNKWAGFVANELLVAPAIKIDLRSDYRTDDRSLSVEVDLYVQENMQTDDLRLSVVITEDKIRDFQLTPQGKIGNYEHRHVLRGFLTEFNGMRLTESLVTGALITKDLNFSLPTSWHAENCSIVAFVNLNGEQKDVLQAHQIKLME